MSSEQETRRRLCRLCRDVPELSDALGHDQLGHRTRNVLCRAGYRTVARVALLTDEELHAIPDLGIKGRARTRERIPYALRPLLQRKE